MSREFKFPDLGEGIAEGELIRWLVKEGDVIQEDQDVAEVETDKALVNIPSPLSGTIEKLHYKEGDKIPVGSVLLSFLEPEKTSAAPAPSQDSSAPKSITNENKKPPSPSIPQGQEIKTEPPILPPLAAPHTRKIARELGVDLNRVQGTGAGGRITETDVQAFATQSKTIQSFPKSPEAFPEKIKSSLSTDATSGPIERIPLKGLRRKISENMLMAAQNTVMVTHIDEAEVDSLVQLRKTKASFAEQRGVKLTLLPFLMKACAIALREYPSLNASLVGEEIILKKYYHFGFAVDTEGGLLVPVLKNVDKKSILHLARELSELSSQARNRSIALEDLKGSSFSITNIGSIGGKAFTPIVNYPDSAILGVGRTYEKPVVRNGEIVVSHVLPLCLTFDHRISDGATAARFINQVIAYLQDPNLLLLEDGEE